MFVYRAELRQYENKRVGAGVVRMRGVGPCGRPLGCSGNDTSTGHGGQPQGPPHRSTTPLPLREVAYQFLRDEVSTKTRRSFIDLSLDNIQTTAHRREW